MLPSSQAKSTRFAVRLATRRLAGALSVSAYAGYPHHSACIAVIRRADDIPIAIPGRGLAGTRMRLLAPTQHRELCLSFRDDRVRQATRLNWRRGLKAAVFRLERRGWFVVKGAGGGAPGIGGGNWHHGGKSRGVLSRGM